MERFPRCTLPPKAFAAVATMAPNAVARPERSEAKPEHDLSTTCPNCMAEMHPEHAHYKCPACGYRDSSSF
jgi:Zn finger protein HypA/HybF involved in hydrogenase expression